MTKRSARLNYYFLKDMNPVIRFLIISDTVTSGATGLLGPIFALYIEGFVRGGNAAVAGLAAGIYLFTKSVLQIPIAHFIDKVRGEKDDFWLMFVCTILMSLVPLLYLVVHTPLQLYLTQFVLGLFTAFTFPTFLAIFTRHIDKEKEGTEWGVYFSFSDLISAALGIVGGYVAVVQGFRPLIIVVVLMSLVGSLILWLVKPYIRPL